MRKGEQVLGQREVGENRQDRSGGARGGVPLDASPAGTIFLLSTFICAKGKSDPRMRFLKTDAGGARARLTSPPPFPLGAQALTHEVTHASHPRGEVPNTLLPVALFDCFAWLALRRG